MVYSLRNRKILFQSDVAHSAQVQQVSICPNEPAKMASVGYDNTVRIWDMQLKQVVSVIEDKAVKNERDG